MLKKNQRKIPKGFELTAPLCSKTQLRKVYHVGDSTVTRWLGEAKRLYGVECKQNPKNRIGARKKCGPRYDPPERIAICLTCESPKCRGYCDKVKRV